VFQKQNKPNQTNSPTKLRLHQHATSLAQLVLQTESDNIYPITSTYHHEPIHEKTIVEAFPNLFLATLLPEELLPQLHRDASDTYWDICVAHGSFRRLFQCVLPGRTFETRLGEYRHHDDRAAIVCAMTAVSVVAGRALGVGDATDGDIMLPPSECGLATDGAEPWIVRVLRGSLERVRTRHPWGYTARVMYRGRLWREMPVCDA
jgi:hypothetical protein